MHSPSAKVIAATLAALLVAAGIALADDGIPTNLSGWLTFAGKVLGSALATGGAGYMKAETNPAPSALETIARRRAGL